MCCLADRFVGATFRPEQDQVMREQVTIDGSMGEGGGQILRSSLALSLVTGRPLAIERIRAGRPKPGLLRQHLTAVRAAAAIGGATVTGDELGSTALTFAPGAVRGGDYTFNVGSAGSTTLVLQTVLPALLGAPAASRLTIEGGTHNLAAPPFDFLAAAFVPLLRRMGVGLELTLEAPGFYPAGGGRIVATIEPAARFTPLTLLERGPVTVRARAVVSSLPEQIAKRELRIVRERLGLDRDASLVETVAGSSGPGNALLIEVASPEVTEVFTGFGRKGVPAETVAGGACDEVEAYLQAGVPVGPHLADQLLLPMALAGGGAFRTLVPTPHTVTNADVIGRFLDVAIGLEADGGKAYRCTVGAAVKEKVS
jgi:RNA 3'-terminal phosphate cyclase (ATP)